MTIPPKLIALWPLAPAGTSQQLERCPRMDKGAEPMRTSMAYLAVAWVG